MGLLFPTATIPGRRLPLAVTRPTINQTQQSPVRHPIRVQFSRPCEFEGIHLRRREIVLTRKVDHTREIGILVRRTTRTNHLNIRRYAHAVIHLRIDTECFVCRGGRRSGCGRVSTIPDLSRSTSTARRCRCRSRDRCRSGCGSRRSRECLARCATPRCRSRSRSRRRRTGSCLGSRGQTRRLARFGRFAETSQFPLAFLGIRICRQTSLDRLDRRAGDLATLDTLLTISESLDLCLGSTGASRAVRSPHLVICLALDTGIGRGRQRD